MTAVRAVACAVLGAVLLLAVIAAMLWAQFGPQNWPLVVWLLAACAVITCAGLGMSALQPDDGAYPEDWREQGWCCRECAVMAWSALRPEGDER